MDIIQILSNLPTIEKTIADVAVIVSALLAIDNIVDGVCKSFGYTKGDTFCANIANFLKKLPGGNKPPAVIILFLLLSSTVFAQSVSNTPSISITQTVQNALQSVNVPGQVTKIQASGLAVNTGVWYDWKAKEVDATYTYPIFGGMNIDNWGTWDYINVGYASPDVLIAGTGLVINVATVVKKWGITPPASIQAILNSASIGLTPMVGIESVGGKNRFTGGPGAYIKISW